MITMTVFKANRLVMEVRTTAYEVHLTERFDPTPLQLVTKDVPSLPNKLCFFLFFLFLHYPCPLNLGCPRNSFLLTECGRSDTV